MWTRDFLFGGLEHSTGWTFLVLFVLVMAGVLIAMLMRYERQLVSRPVGITLLLLRLGVLGLLLITFLEPLFSWTFENQRTGRIVVAVDVSESMTTTDTHASPAEKLRWARALDLIGNANTQERLDRWQAAFDRGEEPEWVADSEAASANTRSDLARSRKERLDQTFAELDAMSRREMARRLLTTGNSPLLGELQKIADVDLVLFAGEALTADTETLGTIETAVPDTVGVTSSDLRLPLLQATGGEEAAVDTLGLIVLSDGQDNAGGDPTRIAARLGYLNSPLYTVPIGSRFRPKDLAVAFVDHPQSVLQDDQPVVAVTIKTSGFEETPTEVILENADGEVERKTITPRGVTANVDFSLEAKELGRHEYTVRMEPREGETRDDNNARTFSFTVVDDKVRVLLIDGEARWEFRYLHTALERDERVEVREVVFDQPFMGVLKDTFFRRDLTLPEADADAERTPFAEADLIVLGDVDPDSLPNDFWMWIEQFVSDAGGTLVVVAGKRHTPLRHDDQRFRDLLPIVNPEEVNITGADGFGPPASRGFHLAITPEGEREAVFQFDGDPLRSRRKWESLPGHLWGMVGTPKPGANVLARLDRGANADPLRDTSKTALFVHQHYGAGQVMWIGIDSTWRWRHRVGDAYHHRFWGQLGRWAVENKAMAGNDSVKLILPRSEIESGEEAEVEAKFAQPFLQQNPETEVRVKVFSLDDDRQPKAIVTLQPDDRKPLVHAAKIAGLKPGEYRIVLESENTELGEEELQAYLTVRERQTIELFDLSANRKLLQEMANASRGRLVEPGNIADLVGLLRGDPEANVDRSETTLWDHWGMLLAFFALLTTEWVIRKLNGLP